MSLVGTVLLIFLVLMLLGALPKWRYNQDWGYAPFSGMSIVLIVVLILLLTGRI